MGRIDYGCNMSVRRVAGVLALAATSLTACASLSGLSGGTPDASSGADGGSSKDGAAARDTAKVDSGSHGDGGDAGGDAELLPGFTSGQLCGPGWSPENGALSIVPDPDAGATVCEVCVVSPATFARLTATTSPIPAPGTYYVTASFRAENDAGAGQGASIFVRASTSAGVVDGGTGGANVIASLSQWTPAQGTIDLAAGDTVEVQLIVNAGCMLVDRTGLDRAE